MPEHTIHLVYECPLAMELWRTVFDSFNNRIPALFHVRDAFPVQLTSDCILFHHTNNNLPIKARHDLSEIIVIVKHVLYRFKFRENIDIYPSIRLATIAIALELEKLTAVRRYRCEWIAGLVATTQDLKTIDGF